jgi:hypothetical protein
MLPFVKTKRQANLKDLKRFGAFKGLVEQKNVVFNSFVCQLGFFGTVFTVKIVVYLTSSCVNWVFLARVGQFKTRVKRAFYRTTSTKKTQFTPERVEYNAP